MRAGFLKHRLALHANPHEQPDDFTGRLVRWAMERSSYGPIKAWKRVPGAGFQNVLA
jgi:hypothetical protein